METLVFTLGQVTTGGQRQEAMISFLPYVLKSLLSLLGEKSMIRGQGWTQIIVAKIQARDDGGSVGG